MHGGCTNLIRCHPIVGRMRLGVRWTRFAIKSLFTGDFDFVANALASLGRLLGYSLRDAVVNNRRVRCNLCGWEGARFYPNTGPGYHEMDAVCPGCRCQGRHRSLVIVLGRRTGFFEVGVTAVEVAPMMRFQEYMLANKPDGYVSFDLHRFAMERGDITRMRYADASQDYFLALHVLEHIPDEAAALAEVRPVLKPGGVAVLQVPVDWSLDQTYEYDKLDRREVGHVRRYGRDFAAHIGAHGFDVRRISVIDLVDEQTIERLGLCREPFFFARKPDRADAQPTHAIAS